MISRHRISGVYIFLGILLAALTVFGCGSSGDDVLVTGPGNYGSISGTIQAPAGSGAVRSVEASVLSAVNLANAYVFLEKDPRVATHSNSLGKFTLSPVTFERHNVIVRLPGSGSKQYKVRSFNIDVTPGQPAKDTGNMQVKLADRKIRVRVNDAGGSTISTATITVWGETFTYIGNGEYESPPLPADETATVTVNVAGRTEIELPAQFVSTAPPVLETTVPPTGSTNVPPTVILVANTPLVNNSGTITVTATARDPENAAMTYKWETTAGSLATTSTGLQAIWTAPSSGTGSATISFRATDAGGLFAGTTLSVGYKPAANQKPVVTILANSSNITTLTSSTSCALTAQATDPDGNSDALSYLWSVTSGSLSTTTQKTTYWTTPSVTATTTVSVSVTVKDAVGDSTTQTLEFTILPAAPVPTASISKPTANEIFTAGSVRFVGQVSLSNNSILPTSNYQWDLQYPGESIYQNIALQTGNFTKSLMSPGTYTVRLTATTTEGVGCSASVSFKINAPPQNLSITVSPRQSSFIASAAVSFTGSANDPDDQTLSYAWYDYSHILNATMTLGTDKDIQNYRDFVPGSHTITLTAADTCNTSASKSIDITIEENTSPTPVISSPADKAWYFVNATVPFSGYAADNEAESGYVATESLSWEISGPVGYTQPSLAATSSFSLRFDIAGTYTLRLNASDTLLATAAVQRSFYINATPTVTLDNPPASGTRYDNGGTFELKAVAADEDTADTLSIAWIDLNSGNTLGNSTTLKTSLDEPGYHAIIARITDSCGVSASVTQSLLINNLPQPGMTINYPQYATAPGNIPILLASSGAAVNLTARATDSENGELDSAHLTSIFSNGTASSTFSGSIIPSRYLDPGKYTLTVQAIDDNGSPATDTFSFVVWDATAYYPPLSSPSTILFANSSYYIADTGSSKIKKFTSLDAPPIEIGGPGTDPGSFSYLVGLTDIGGNLCTLEGFPSATATRIQLWTSDTATESSFAGPGTAAVGNASFTSPAAMTTDGTSLYICDTLANKLMRLDPSTKKISTIVSNPDGTKNFDFPAGIRYLNSSSIFVADHGNNRIVTMDANLGCSGIWTASNPVDITSYDTTHFITVDLEGNRIQFWDSNGQFSLNAGKTGATLGQFSNPVSVVTKTDPNQIKIIVLEQGSGSNPPRVQVFTLPDTAW